MYLPRFVAVRPRAKSPRLECTWSFSFSGNSKSLVSNPQEIILARNAAPNRMTKPHRALCARKVSKTPPARKAMVFARVERLPLTLKYLPRRLSGTTSAMILPQAGEVNAAEIE